MTEPLETFDRFEELAGEAGQDPGPGPRRARPRRSPYDLALMVGSLAGAIVMVGTVISYAADLLPFAKKSDLQQLSSRVSQVEEYQLEGLEIQLADRVQRLGDQLSKAVPGSQALLDLRHEQNEAQQRLEAVRAQIARRQSVRDAGGQP